MPYPKHSKFVGSIALLLILVFATTSAILVSQNETVQLAVAQFGYLGVVIAGVLAGINVLVPIPAATLTPIFTEAGLSIPLIIAGLTIGTVIADFAGYGLGHLGKHALGQKYPKITSTVTRLAREHHLLVLPVVFVCAAIMPVPNEVFVIPLALAGFSFAKLLIPLFFGSLINQTMLVYGFSSIFAVFF